VNISRKVFLLALWPIVGLYFAAL